MQTVTKPLRVLHYPQVPCDPFIVNVDNELSAYKIIDVLATQHLWLQKNNFIPDYSNMFVVEMFDDGEWCSYYTEDGYEWEDVEERINTEKQFG